MSIAPFDLDCIVALAFYLSGENRLLKLLLLGQLLSGEFILAERAAALVSEDEWLNFFHDLVFLLQDDLSFFAHKPWLRGGFKQMMRHFF